MMMTSTVPTGKEKGLQQLGDSRGVIAALAIDQRSALTCCKTTCENLWTFAGV
jgi:tagatose-1,6-bisphosphate aldolase